ncbi:ATP-binding protein [Rhodococcus sp. NPDC003318]|uniref:sensor histidine kinase n=1 Tax=Rhodococcus sp. NPDC003318 TaxID=3364503 RepID=UPI0036C86DE4
MRPRLPAWTSRARRRVRPVRVRLTLLATALVALTLTVAAGIVLVALYRSTGYSADLATTARARQIATVAETDGVGALDESLMAFGRHVDIVQVVDADGNVVASGQRYPNGPLSEGLQPGEEQRAGDLSFGPDGPEFRTTLVGVVTPDAGPVTVEVGTNEGRLYARVRFFGALSAAVIPIAVLGTALLSYWFVTRTLRPVDDIRRQVDDISGGAAGQRVPVPDTGDEIATLAVTMNAMLDRIDAARTEQMRFVGDASHELNSPLTTLVGLLDLASATRQPIDPETVDTVMMPEAQRLQGMVADLLFLARADENGVPLRLAEVDLDEIVSAEITRLEALGHTVTADIAAVRVRGDGEKLARALRNIADNAVRHTRDRLHFGMRVDRPSGGDTAGAGTVTVTVSDNGPGIPDADRTRVLERFVRLDSARDRDSGGSGLGLAIVDEIVRAHHGRMVITDAAGPGGGVTGAAGDGVTVGFTLPVRTWD